MNRKICKARTLHDSSAHRHFQGSASIKQGLFCRHRRRLRAALALPAAAFLLYSCDPPASPLASPSSASPLTAVPEVTRSSGLPNMEKIEQRLKVQYASAESQGVEFNLSRTSGTTVSAVITYPASKLRKMEIGGTKHDIKTITITREVDGQTIPTTVEYKDDSGTTRKTITSRYVHPPNAASNNARQSLESGPRLAEAEGRTLDIRGEEKDGDDKILRTFEATEEIQDGTTILRTTYFCPDKEGFKETVTTKNGILTQKVISYSAGAAPAEDTTPPEKDETKTETITYEESAELMFYPTEVKPQSAVAVYKDVGGLITRRVETTKDGTTITTTPTDEGGTLAVHKNDKGTVTERVKTTPTDEGGTLAVHKNAAGKETRSVETKKNGSTITTKPPNNYGVTLVEYKDGKGTVTERVETTPTHDGGTVAMHSDGKHNLTKRVETKRDKSTITKTPTDEGGALAVHRNRKGVEISRVETTKDGSTITTTDEGSVKELVIHSSVTEIGEEAFQNKKLTSVMIPPSVTEIGESAFKGNKLTSVTIGNGFEAGKIGDDAFKDNPTLKTVRITGNGPIKEKAFYYDYNSYWSTNQGVFAPSDSSGIELVIEEGITSIGDYAFSSSKLTSVTIPLSVNKIEEQAFSNNKLTSVTIGNGVKKIGKGAFRDNKLTSVILPKDLYKNLGTAFDNNPDGLKFYEYDEDKSDRKGAGLNINTDGSTFITMPDGSTITTKLDGSRHLVIADDVKTIGEGAFQNKKLTSVVIPPPVTEIGDYAFYANKLTSVVIPPLVTEIGDYAFRDNKLTSVILPKGLYHKRGTAFENNPDGLKFYAYDGSKPDKKGTGLNINAHGQPLITMPDGSTITTKDHGSRHLVIADGVKTIGEGAFQNKELTSVVIPPSVTSIGESAFKGNKLTSVTIGNGVKRIGKGAFRDNKLTSVILPKDLYKNIGTAFDNNPDGLKFYAYDADKSDRKGEGLNIDTDGSTFITMPDGSTITTKLDGSRHLVIADDVKTIGEGAFQNKELTSVVIPPSVTSIGKSAFKGNKLTSVTIGNGFEAGKIGDDAFKDNPTLKTVRITGTGAIKKKAFYYDYSSWLSSNEGIFVPSGSSGIELIIEEGITSIGNYAFGDNKLTSVTIGNGVKTIENGAFRDNKLTSVILPKELYKNLGTAFDNNPDGLKFYEYDEDKSDRKGAGLNINTDGSTFITMPDGSTITTKLDGSRHLVIADGVKTIGEGAFQNKELTSVVIPPSVTKIGESAFKGNKLTSVILPKGLYKNLGTAFDNNPDGLKFYEYDEDKSDRKGAGLNINTDGSTFITMPDGSTITTKLDGSRHLVIADGVKAIGEGAFQNKELTSVVIPPSVTEIGESAFKGNKLTSVTIGNRFEAGKIGHYAFAQNPTLKTVRITGTGAIKEEAFYYDYSSLSWSSDEGVFAPSGSSGIELIIGEGITSIGDYAFSSSRLTSVTIPPSVTKIRDYAFYDNKLTSVILPEALYKKRGNAFTGNPAGLKFYEYSASAPGSKDPELGTD